MSSRPHVVCHMLVSLDGRIHPSRWTASPDGERRPRGVLLGRGVPDSHLAELEADGVS